MKIAVLIRDQEHISLRIYRDSILRELVRLGIQLSPFSGHEKPSPVCDLVWDPGLGMRKIPSLFRWNDRRPLVATVHGIRAFSLPAGELAPTWQERLNLFFIKRALISDWTWFSRKVAAVITVSNFGAAELRAAFPVPIQKLHVIHHGLDHSVFTFTDAAQNCGEPYFLTVSRYQPIKNVDRLFSAYAGLKGTDLPKLVAIMPDYRPKKTCPGITVIHEMLSQKELAPWYRGAVAAVFPSLRESFGMPILEAMACGCPVITSNSTGCAEVAGDAALLVDPRSVNAIAAAMERLIEDREMRNSLREKGIARAREFTWSRSAHEHLKVFKQVLGESG